MNSAAKKAKSKITESDLPPIPDFLVLDTDISKTEAESLRVPIRIGFNGEQFIWYDDIDPE